MTMDLITREELKALAGETGEHCVSLFMPAHPSTAQSHQDPIRYKNLLRQAEEQLAERGYRFPKDYLAPAEDVQKRSDFWTSQSNGLAVFLTPELFRAYRLPLDMPELAVVNQRLYLKPLMPLFSGDGRFLILAVSQNNVRLYQATRHTIEEIEPEGIPRDLASALYDDPEKSLQFHTRTSSQAAGHPGGERTAMFHGQGVAGDDNKDQISRFFRKVDKSLRALLEDLSAPLVFAGVDYTFPLYREVSGYPNLAEKSVEGNPELFKPAELHAKAWEIVEPVFERDREQALARFHDQMGTGLATNDLLQAVPAAATGRVDSLFVPRGVQQWGRFEPDSLEVTVKDSPEAGDEDLLDLAAVQTFLRGGKVFPLQPDAMPGNAHIAAVYRY